MHHTNDGRAPLAGLSPSPHRRREDRPARKRCILVQYKGRSGIHRKKSKRRLIMQREPPHESGESSPVKHAHSLMKAWVIVMRIFRTMTTKTAPHALRTATQSQRVSHHDTRPSRFARSSPPPEKCQRGYGATRMRESSCTCSRSPPGTSFGGAFSSVSALLSADRYRASRSLRINEWQPASLSSTASLEVTDPCEVLNQ